MDINVAAIRSANIEDYRRYLLELHHGQKLEGLLVDWLSHLARGEAMPLRGTVGDENNVLVYEDEFVRISFRCLKRIDRSEGYGSSAPIYLAPSDSLFIVLLGAPLEVMPYYIDGDIDPEVFQKGRALVRGQRHRAEIGDVVRVRRTVDAMELDVVGEHSFVWQVSSVASDPIVWNFDRQSLLSTYSTSALVGASRDQFICRTLCELERREALADIARVATSSPFHFVRLEAVKSVLLLDDAAGMDLLARAAEQDSHPHVRNACAKTLSNLIREGANA